MKNFIYFFLTNTLVSIFPAFMAQNETSKWYFGGHAGVNFSTNPPSVLNNGALNVTTGCSAISNTTGGILFYTDGVTIWDQTHAVMANGTGLLGTNSAQSSVIVKQPGNSNMYYVFTVQGGGGAAGLNYSVVDMSLATGNGSVTLKNVPLFASPCEEKLSAVKHCNQTDVWVMVKEMSSANFLAYQLSSAGVNTLAVLSPVAATGFFSSARVGPSTKGQMKFSPNGKKLSEVFTISNASGGVTEVDFNFYSFDNSTGVLTGSMSAGGFSAPLGNSWGYGTEFSPNSSQIYYTYHGLLIQYNSCSLPTTINGGLAPPEGGSGISYDRASMQIGADGKIYIAKSGSSTLDVINNPNLQGAACGYSTNAFPVGTHTVFYGLPNFVTSYFEQMPGPFTFSAGISAGCLNVAFSSPTICPFSDYVASSRAWDFGDPASGAGNTSPLANPTHSFSAPGTYTVRLITTYYCNKTDTLYKTLSVSSPSFSVLTPSLSCGPGNATIVASGGTGPYSYTWSPSSQTTPVANNISPGIYFISVKDNSGGCSGTFSTVIPQNVISASVITNNCNGVGAASVVVGGGSGTYSYFWSSGLSNSASISGLGLGTYTVMVLDLVSQCSLASVYNIYPPPQLMLNLMTYSPSACVGGSITLFAGASGGTGPYSYSWSGGSSTFSSVANEQNAGVYTYTCMSVDAHSCSATSAISVNFIGTPVLSVSSVSICQGSVATLTASGASSYTWNPGTAITSIFTVSPASSSFFTVTGDNAGCTSSVTTSVAVLPRPIINAGSNSPLCGGSSLNLVAGGGVMYFWAGPAGFLSSAQNPVIALSVPGNSGTYSLHITGVNSCTAGTTVSVLVNPSPTLSIAGRTVVCRGETLHLLASGANTYSWSTGSVSPGITTTLAPGAPLWVTGTSGSNSCTSTYSLTIIMNECLGTLETELSELGVRIFPNPAQNDLNIRVEEKAQIVLYSELGVILLETTISEGLSTIDMSSYSNSVYFIKVINSAGGKVFRVLKKD